jgi:hypothetical protein
MSTTQVLYVGAAVLAASLAAMGGQQTAGPAKAAVQVGANDLGGVVTSPKGPEAGVWVIAETTDLPTKYVKIVVTDDQGRYLMPDLPAKASYTVWAATGWSTPKKCTPRPARRSISRPSSRPARAPRHSTIQPATGCR